MTEHPLVSLMRKTVHPNLRPCVNISGGIDSTILLHHLSEQTDEQIYTYTVGFPNQTTEFDAARKVAEHYDTCHREIQIENMLEEYSTILQEFPYPRFNLWPFWAARQANKDGCIHCYIAEGGDEHFGGYWYKPKKTYVEHWNNFFTFVYPTYKNIYDFWCLKLVVPFHPDNLNWEMTFRYYDENQNKRFLRAAYKGIIPDFAVNRKKLPGRFSYWVMWDRELKRHFPNSRPQTEDDIRWLLNKWVTREWLKVRSWEPPEISVSVK